MRKVLAVKGRVIGATWAHFLFDSRASTAIQTNGMWRMPGGPVGAPLWARTAMKEEGGQ